MQRICCHTQQLSAEKWPAWHQKSEEYFDLHWRTIWKMETLLLSWLKEWKKIQSQGNWTLLWLTLLHIFIYQSKSFLKCSVPQDARYGTTVDHPYEYSYFPWHWAKHFMPWTNQMQKMMMCTAGTFPVAILYSVPEFFLQTYSVLGNFPSWPKNSLRHIFKKICDYACNLHQYLLNREPSRFSKTIFLVDRLH